MNYTLNVYRGRNFVRKFVLTKDGAAFVPMAGDVIRFGVKLSPHEKDYRYRKDWDFAAASAGSVTLELTADDTAAFSKGTYYWDMGLQRGEDFWTIGGVMHSFIVENAITRKEDANG